MSNPANRPLTNVPPVAIAASIVALVFIGAGFIVAISVGGGLDDRSTPLALTLLGLIASTVPAMVSALYSSRASNDLRNGTVVAKVKEGTHEALQEAQIVTRDGPVATATTTALNAQTAALTALLGKLTEGTRVNPPSQEDLR